MFQSSWFLNGRTSRAGREGKRGEVSVSIWQLGRHFRAKSKAFADGEGGGIAGVLLNKHNQQILAVRVIGNHAADLARFTSRSPALRTILVHTVNWGTAKWSVRLSMCLSPSFLAISTACYHSSLSRPLVLLPN